MKRDVMIAIMFEEFNSWGHGPGGFFQTKLIWKDNHPPFKSNKSNSLGRLSSLVKKSTHRNQLERSDNIIQDQIKEGVVKKVDKFFEQEIAEGEKVFCLLQRPVIRQSAETTKLRVVYVVSSKSTKNSASLSDCLEVGPSF